MWALCLVVVGWFAVCDCGINQPHSYSNVAVNDRYGMGSVMVGTGISTNGKNPCALLKMDDSEVLQ